MSANVLDQTVTNNIMNSASGGEGGKFDFKEGTGKLKFGENTFEHQAVNVNNMNTGVHVGQQGAISIAGSINNNGT